MNINYAIAFVVIALAVAAGQLLTQFCLLARAKRRRKQQPAAPLPKPEPQAIEFNVVLSGVDDVEAGLARVEAVIGQIAAAADGVPITINNYYGQMIDKETKEPPRVEAQSRIVIRFAQPEAMEPQGIECYAVGPDQLRATARELERMAAEFYDSLDSIAQEGDK